MTKQTEIISLKDPWVVPTKYWHRLDGVFETEPGANLCDWPASKETNT